MVQALRRLGAAWLPIKLTQTEHCSLIVTGWLPWWYLCHGTTNMLQDDELHMETSVILTLAG